MLGAICFSIPTPESAVASLRSDRNRYVSRVKGVPFIHQTVVNKIFKRARIIFTTEPATRTTMRVGSIANAARVLAVVLLLPAVTIAAPLTAIGAPLTPVDALTVEFTSAARASSFSTAYAVGATDVTAISVSSSPKSAVLASVADVGPCEGLFVFESRRTSLPRGVSRTRLAVTCAETSSFLVYAVDADGSGAKRIVEIKNEARIGNPRDLVVVNDTLAFIASAAHSRVVAVRLDPNEQDQPVIGESFKLSGVDTLTLGPLERETLRVMSGAARRVTTLKYTPAGTLQLVGSTKDSRLESASGTCVGVGDGSDRLYTYVASPKILGGTLSILNSSEFGAPQYLVGVHAGGAPNADSESEWSPVAHVNLKGATDVSVHGDRAYVAASTLGAIALVDLSDPSRPTVTDTLRSPALAGVNKVSASPDGKFLVSLVNGTSAVIASADDAVVAAASKRRRFM
jgi:hypothetical protein